MPRKSRIDFPGILQHIISRGIEKRNIFNDEKDRQHFLHHLGEILIDSGSKCYGWVLMPNHFHLILLSGETKLSIIMKKLLTRYAVYFNKRHKRSGYLFQNRYKSIVCDKDSYLLELVRYVNLNPLRAGLVRSMDELSKYRWSGHQVLLGKIKYDWQVKDEILSYFGRSEKAAIIKYQEYLKEGINDKNDFEGGGLIRSVGGIPEAMKLVANRKKQMYDERILGDGQFVEEVLKNHEIKEQKSITVRNKALGTDNLIKFIAEQMEVDMEELSGNKKSEKLCVARSLISYIGQAYLGITGAEIGLKLGKSRAGISLAYGRGKNLLEKNEMARNILNNLTT